MSAYRPNYRFSNLNYPAIIGPKATTASSDTQAALWDIDLTEGEDEGAYFEYELNNTAPRRTQQWKSRYVQQLELAPTGAASLQAFLGGVPAQIGPQPLPGVRPASATGPTKKRARVASGGARSQPIQPVQSLAQQLQSLRPPTIPPRSVQPSGAQPSPVARVPTAAPQFTSKSVQQGGGLQSFASEAVGQPGGFSFSEVQGPPLTPEELARLQSQFLTQSNLPPSYVPGGGPPTSLLKGNKRGFASKNFGCGARSAYAAPRRQSMGSVTQKRPSANLAQHYWAKQQ